MNDRTRPTAAPRAVLALITAMIAAALLFGTGSAGAQGFAIDEIGTVTVDSSNTFCVDVVHTGASDPDNVTVSLTNAPPGFTAGSYAFGVAPNDILRWRLFASPGAVTEGVYDVTVTAVDDLGTVSTADDLTDSITVRVEAIPTSEAALVVGSGTNRGSGYSIDCAQQAREVNGFLRQASNFGPTGTVAIDGAVVVKDAAASISDAYLSDLDVLVEGWLFETGGDEYTTAELNRIEAWVEAGGVLIATEDSGAADQLAVLFGTSTNTPAGPCTHTPSEAGDPATDCPEITDAPGAATHPLVAGRFGDWSTSFLETSGTVGDFADTTGWTVIGRKSGGAPVIMTRDVGQGRVILLADEGLLRTHSYVTGSNEAFVGNLFAWALANLVPTMADVSTTVDANEEFTLDICGSDATQGDAPVTATTTDAIPTGVEQSDTGGCTLTGSIGTPATYELDFTGTDGDGDTDTFLVTIIVTENGVIVPTPTCRGLEATIIGQPDDTVIRGTNADDVIVGTMGDDVIRGLGGDDIICALGGDDNIAGGVGDDTIVAGGGDDSVSGGIGADLLIGGTGVDTMNGNGASDIVSGNGGSDILSGGLGADRVLGGLGRDLLNGNAGEPDRCNGGVGLDTEGVGCERLRSVERTR